MVNPLPPRFNTGVAGELLVQIRLLQYHVQAAPPIEDSGNDLIAIRNGWFRAISVRATPRDYFNKPKKRRKYHILAVVHLAYAGQFLLLDQTRIFLIPRDEVAGISHSVYQLDKWLLTSELVDYFFPPSVATEVIGLQPPRPNHAMQLTAPQVTAAAANPQTSPQPARPAPR